MPALADQQISITVGQAWWVLSAVGGVLAVIARWIWTVSKKAADTKKEWENLKQRVDYLDNKQYANAGREDFAKLDAKIDKLSMDMARQTNSLGDELDRIREGIHDHNLLHSDIKHSLEAGRERFQKDDVRLGQLELAAQGFAQDLVQLKFAAGMQAPSASPYWPPNKAEKK